MLNRPISVAQIRTHRNGILVFCAVLLVLLVVHLVWVSPAAQEKNDNQGQAAQRSELINKYQDKLNQSQQIRDNLTKQEKELKELQKRLFQGKDPYQLAASLSELLSTKDGPKLDIKTYQVVASKEYGLYQEVHIRFNFMSNVEGLHYFLERLKNFQTAILIKEMNIQRIQKKSGPDLVTNVILAALLEKADK